MEEPQPGCRLPVAAAGVLGAGGGGGGGECGAPSLFSSGAARCRCPCRARRQCRASGWGLWSPFKRGVAEGGLPGAAVGLRGPQRAAAADRSLGAAGGGRRCEAGPRAEGSVAALPSGARGSGAAPLPAEPAPSTGSSRLPASERLSAVPARRWHVWVGQWLRGGRREQECEVGAASRAQEEKSCLAFPCQGPSRRGV